MAVLKLNELSGEMEIVDTWTADDIREAWGADDDEDKTPLTDQQIYDVMDYIVDTHDANRGINWQNIEDAIDTITRIKK